jgi:DNA-binding MarR family transcriptional regulator
VAEERELMDALVQVSFEVTAILTRVGTANQLSLTQLRVLGILRDRRLTMSQLAGHLGLDRSTISGLIDRAEQRGLVERVANAEDRRSSLVQLAPAGHQLAERLGAEIADAIAHLAVDLTADERRRLRSLLERVLGR